MKLVTLIRDEFYEILNAYQALEHKAQAIEQEYNRANEQWEKGRDSFLYDQAMKEQVFSDPKEKVELDRLEREAENAKSVITKVVQEKELLLRINNKLSSLIDYQKKIAKQEQNPKLFREHFKTKYMNDYRDTLRSFLREIDKTMNAVSRFMDIGKVQDELDSVKTILNSKLEGTNKRAA
ncbi:MAG: hypothetical protein ABW096_09515 [Candidatus Thiodiazotropha sp.]